jgi:integrase/recombinase XerD
MITGCLRENCMRRSFFGDEPEPKRCRSVPEDPAGLWSGQPLFQSVNSAGTAVTGRALNRYNAWAAIRKRAKAAGFLTPVGCHTWRATGITIYLENDGRLEHAQQMAGHESPRTTKLYDRTKDEITLSEVERIRL